MTSTNFSKPTINATGYERVSNPDETDALLLQTGDYLLLQDGSSYLLLNEGLIDNPSTNFSKGSIASTNFSRPI